MKVAVIQTDPFWEEKEKNLVQINALVADSDSDIRLFVLPEMFSTGFSMNADGIAENMQGTTIAWVRELANKKQAAICGSIAFSENGHFYNRLLFVKPDGSYCCYDKRHLHSPSGEQNVYTAGKKQVVCNHEGLNFNLQVCYDLRFPVWSRNRGETDVIIYSANWPVPRIHAWKSLLIARAIENQCYVLGANRTGVSPDGTKYSGDSQIIDPIGEIKAYITSDPGIITFNLEKRIIEKYRNSLPALKDADKFSIDF